MSVVDRGRLALYYRLILSYSDFKHAYRCAQYSISEHEAFAKTGGDDLLLKALYCSMVVSYARPFNSRGESRIGSIPPLGENSGPPYSAEEAEIHAYMLVCRNRFLAHSDANAIDPDPFIATDLPKEIVIPEKNDALAPYTLEYTTAVLGVTEKAYRWCVEERMRLEGEVKKWLPRRPWSQIDPEGVGT